EKSTLYASDSIIYWLGSPISSPVIRAVRRYDRIQLERVYEFPAPDDTVERLPHHPRAGKRQGEETRLAEILSTKEEYERLAQQTLEGLFLLLAPSGPLEAEIAQLTETVEQLFRQATKRFAVPSAAGCRMVAFQLTMLRGHLKTFPKQPARQKEVIKCGKR